jgi:hypothetical protein
LKKIVLSSCYIALNESGFHGMHFEILEEKQVELNEGKYHIGIADVVRFIGRK